MKKKLSLLLACVLCLGLMPCAYADNNPFNDVAPGFWAYDAIMETYNDGVMMGTGTDENGNKVFSPSGKLNMNQFFTVLTRAFYNEEVLNCPVAGAWPNQNFAVAQEHNLFNGIASWLGDTEVTREVMAEMMYRVMVDKSVVLPNDTEIQATINKIPDIAAVDGNYRTAVAVCYYWELLAGVDAQGTFAPKGVLNRAQTAVIYTRLKKAVNVLGAGIPENPGTAAPDTTAPGTTQNPGDTQNPQAAPSATLTNGMPVTEENVLALIEEYRNGTREPGEKAKAAGFTSYADTKPTQRYDPYNPPYFGAIGSGTECAKFAFAFWDDIFGDAPYREVTDPWQVRPGDLIHFPSHWCIAVQSAYQEPGRDYPLTQTAGGGKTGSIGWGLNAIRGYATLYTRYPLPYETE